MAIGTLKGYIALLAINEGTHELIATRESHEDIEELVYGFIEKEAKDGDAVEILRITEHTIH